MPKMPRASKEERHILAVLGGDVTLVDYCNERVAAYALRWPNGVHKPVKPAIVGGLVRKGLLIRSGWNYVHTPAGLALLAQRT